MTRYAPSHAFFFPLNLTTEDLKYMSKMCHYAARKNISSYSKYVFMNVG